MRMMANDKEIALELAKNKTDEIIVKQELNSAKDKFINDLKNTFGEEMKMYFKELNKPIKLKKPFSMKIKEFLNKINNVLGL